jgi:hypothetical protein
VLGIAHYRSGACNEAVKDLEQAEGLRAKYEGTPFLLALAHWQLGNKKKADGYYRQGNAWIEQQHPLSEDLQRLQAEARSALATPRRQESASPESEQRR